jgi:hypothetical protein
MDDFRSVGARFWARISRNFVLSPRQLLLLFGLKPLKCFLFLAPRVCPLVNLPSIKRAGPTALSLIPPKT